MGMFDFMADRGAPTWEDVQRRRAMVEALAQTGNPTTFGGGLSALGGAIGAVLGDRRTDKAEAERASIADGVFEAALGGVPQDNSMLAQALGGASGNNFAMTGDPLRDGIAETAAAIGADPVDLATAISYETAGTFDPTKAGPTTQWGQHRGLIQFGEPQARQYGVDWNDPVGSQLGADGAIANYFRDRGFKPGMSGLDLYSTINAGSPGRYSASDANNGGAPGTVADKWTQQMAPHREKAMALLGGSAAPSGPQAAGINIPAPAPVNVAMIRAINNPYLSPEQKQILAGVMAQQQAQQITPYQAAQLQMEQQRMAQAMAPAPVEYGWQMAPDGTLIRTDSTGQAAPVGQYAKPEGAPEAPASVREYEYYVQQAQARGEQPMPYEQFSVEKARAGASSVNVSTGSEVGTIPQGYELFVDPQTGARSMRPITGGPEDQSKAAAVKAENMATSTDIITSAAAKARAAAANRQFGGLGQGVAAQMPWTDSAEVARQVEVLKANAKVENLQAMRAASATGGALGAVSDSENAMLAAKAGALDPSSPTFERDLADYERTLLRIVHGRQAGDTIFEKTRDVGNASGAVPEGIDPADWEFMTPEEKALFQ